MTYATAEALRMALEQRLNNQARQTGIAVDRLRRRVVFERVVARLTYAGPGKWVVKGGWHWRCASATKPVAPRTSTWGYAIGSTSDPP